VAEHGGSPVTTLLADYHHHDLWESLELMCARLGWTLLRPMGMEWFDEGYWNFERAWHGDAVAKQYLEPWHDDMVWEATGVLDPRDGIGTPFERAHKVRKDKSHDRWQHLITLEQARDLKPDIVMASVAHNHEGLHRFAKEVGATFGIHLGNVRFSDIDMREDRWDLADFGIVTAIMPSTPPKPHVVVHQEFSLTDFRHEPPPPDGVFTVSSFVNCFPENPQAYEGWKAVASHRPEYDWKVYGAYGSVPTDEYAAGNLGQCAAVGDAMRQADVAWHTKQWSDGFGHVMHNWFSVGRPVIGHEWYYRSQLAGPLWQEGVTSFDITDKSVPEVVAILDRLYQDPDLRLRMGENAAARFREVVDFDAEEQAIRAMFAQVLP
jgi:glycosyltransferase involved in cell wall biosynthesis